MTAAAKTKLTRVQLSKAIGRLERYLDVWRSVDDEALANAARARQKRDELASRYMQEWAAPVDDPEAAIDSEVSKDAFVQEMFQAKDDLGDLHLILDAPTGFIVLASIQLALRHPQLPPFVREQLEKLSNDLLNNYASYPKLHAIGAAGFLSEFDQEDGSVRT